MVERCENVLCVEGGHGPKEPSTNHRHVGADCLRLRDGNAVKQPSFGEGYWWIVGPVF